MDLKTQIQQSALLSDTMKTQLLMRLPSLSSEQHQALKAMLDEATQKQADVESKKQAEMQAAQKKHLTELENTLKHKVPELMQKMEQKDRAHEAPKLDSLIQKLNAA